MLIQVSGVKIPKISYFRSTSLRNENPLFHIKQNHCEENTKVYLLINFKADTRAVAVT